MLNGLAQLLRNPRSPRADVRLAAPIAALAFAFGPASALTLKEIGEWVVSCDNNATCSLVNASQLSQLRVAQPSPFGLSRICVHRQGGPVDEAQMFLTLRSRMPINHAVRQEDRLLRLVGGEVPQPDITLRHRGMDHWEVPAAQAGQLLAGLHENTRLDIVSRDGTTLERLSVHGIDQALSHVDQAQLRAGTVTALREKGEKTAKTVPVRPSVPSIVTAPLRKLASASAPSPVAVQLQRQACGAPGLDTTVAYRLLGDQRRADRILWVTPCDPKPGIRRDLFIIENADGTAEAAHFPGFLPARPTGQPGLLSTPRLDAETGLIREQWIASVPPSKDESCAIQRLWGWNGQAFELAEERRSLSCAGIASGYWARTYARPVITPAPKGVVATAASFQPPC